MRMMSTALEEACDLPQFGRNVRIYLHAYCCVRSGRNCARLEAYERRNKRICSLHSDGNDAYETTERYRFMCAGRGQVRQSSDGNVLPSDRIGREYGRLQQTSL